MNSGNIKTATTSAAEDHSGDAITSPSSEVGFLLAQFRCAALRAQITINEFDAAGIALESGLINAETALAMLDEAGLLPLIRASS